MLIGRFDDALDAPYLDGAVSIPALGIRDRLVSFMVDTGASRCLIGPVDIQSMGIDIGAIDLAQQQIFGVSGQEWCFREEAYLAFSDAHSDLTHYYAVPVLISKRNSSELQRFPSVLGRDILNQWTMHYRPHEQQPSLTFEVGDDDHLIIGGGERAN